MLDAVASAHSRAEITGEPVMAWMEAFAKAEDFIAEGFLTEEVAMLSASLCQKARTFDLLLTLFSEHAKEFPKEPPAMELFQARIGGYAFEMKAWVESLDYLYDWLVDKERHATFEEALSFLTSCAERASESVPPRALLPVATETLDDFGFEDI